ncbi:hypothetical protein HaLaN_29155, partial [Haematococcus lacustris]
MLPPGPYPHLQLVSCPCGRGLAPHVAGQAGGCGSHLERPLGIKPAGASHRLGPGPHGSKRRLTSPVRSRELTASTAWTMIATG